MKKKRKTYAVQGMMEYHTTARIGRNSIKVSFTGGSISNGCAQPARYTTSNLIMQNAIEGCADFLSGRIRLERVRELDEEIRIEAPTGSAEASPEERPADAESISPEDRPADAAEEHFGNQEQEMPAEEAELEVVEASCKDVAKQYLEEHFGENPAKLRTRDDVQRCAAGHGIRFEFV